jgi:signal transduction histidine kinase
VFATIVTVITQIELLTAPSIEGSVVVQSAAFAAMTISIAWRRTAPLFAAGLLSAGLVAQTLQGEAKISGGLIALLIVMYSVASYAKRREAVIGGAMILASAFLYPFVADVNFADEVGNSIIVIAPWGFGRAIRSRQRRAVDAEARTVRIASEREQHVNEAVSQERGRIARDMHDIVAHGVSVMVLQSGAARQTMRADAARAEELLLNVEDSGRQALDELHLLLQVLKTPSTGEIDESTSLAIASLNDLAQRTSGTSTSAQITIVGSERPLSPGLEISVYRIAQEALTNAIKHGNASLVDVVLTYGTDSIELSVTDDGQRTTGSEFNGGGNGLIGMRERADLFGGTLTAGPRSPGPGWLVTAELPLPETT